MSEATGQIEIPGLQIEREIGRGAHSVVYRAHRDGDRFAVKVSQGLRGELSSDARLRFRLEGAVLARVDDPHVVKVFEAGEHEGLAYVVLELLEGKKLSQLLDRGALPETLVVSIGRDVAGALGAVHAQGFVHRDVKPANIVIDAEERAKLIDFGFVAHSGKRLADDANELVGTLQYAAPEHTGALKRPLDGRSDLYGLGVVLFEAATGRLPFESADAAELIRQHASVAAPSVRSINERVSPALDRVIAKLLAKEPHERYSSARALAADLARIDAINERLAGGAPVALDDAEKIGARVGTPMPLVGRDADVTRIREHWARAAGGSGAVALMLGEAGSGKSRLLQDCRAALAHEGAVAWQAYCAPGDRPFSVIRMALDAWLGGVAGGEERAQRVLAVCEKYAPFLKPVSDAVAARFPTTDAFSGQDQDQLRAAIVDFVLELASSAGPMLICVEDVQWMDEASRDVLRRLALGLARAPLLLLASARTEASASDQVELFRKDVAPVLVGELSLRGLEEKLIAEFIRALLGGIASVEAAFTRHAAARTGGNPRLLIEYVNAAFEAGLLFPRWGQWLADAAGLEEVQLPTDVQKLVLARVHKLSPFARDVLRMAAAMGLRFSGKSVADARGGAAAEVFGALSEGVQMQLIEERGGGDFVFVHTGVSEALLNGVEPLDLRAIHQRIAEALDRDEARRDLHRLAHHYLKGDRTRNPRRVFEVCALAGQRALEECAPEAFDLLKQAEDTAAASNLACTPELLRALGEACLRRNDIDEAVHYLRRAVEASTSPVAKARIHERLARVFVSKYGASKARPELVAAFGELGASYPSVDDARPDITAPADLPLRAPADDTDELMRLRALADVYDCVMIMEVLGTDVDLARMSAQHAIAIAHEIGKSAQLARSYMAYAFVSGTLQDSAAVEKYGKGAIAVAEELGDRHLVAKSTAYCGMAEAFAGADSVSERRLAQCYAQHGRWLDPDGFNMTCGVLSSGFVIRGYAREAVQWVERLVARLIQSDRTSTGDHYLMAYGGAALGMLGRFRDGADWLERCRRAVDLNDAYTLANILACQLLFQLENGETGAPAEATIEARRKIALPPAEASFHYLRFFFVYQAHVRVAQVLSAPESARASGMAKLEQALEELRRAAHVPVLQAHLLVVEGVCAWLNEKLDQAIEWFDRAERLARDADHPWATFESHRWRACVERDRGNAREARREARVAHAIAVDQGWEPRARSLQAEFDFEPAGSADAATAPADAQGGSNPLQARFAQVIGELARATATIFDPEQQARTCLDRLAQLLVAERAYLFLCKEGSDELVLAAGRNAAGNDLPTLHGYSTTVIERVRANMRPVIVSGTAEGAMLGSRSVVANNLLSIIAAPIVIRERFMGVVYLDSRVAKGIFSKADLQILDGITQHIAIALETTRAARIEIARAALEKDLAVTAAVQSLILPKANSLRTASWNIAGWHKPATVSGGDWWWYEEQSDGGVVVVVGDVTGHGAGAAMVTAIVASCYEAVRLHAQDRTLPFRLTTIDAMLTKLCAGQYGMTIAATQIEPASRTLSWWNAGGPPMLVMNPKGAVTVFTTRGVGLGSGGVVLGEKSARFEGGERILMFTDGVVELKTSSKRDLGLRGLVKIFEATHGRPVEEARAQMAEALDQVRGATTQDDDITFVMLDLHAPAAAPS